MKTREKKSRTMKSQITVTFIGLLFLSMLAITIINGLFLEKYYVFQKAEVLLQAKGILESIDREPYMEDLSANLGDIQYYEEEEPKNYPENIAVSSSQYNLSWVVIDRAVSSYMHWGENDRMLQSRLFGYVYLENEREGSRILKEEKDCVVQQVHDDYVGMDYVECWGTFENGDHFLIRTPLESIKDSVSISNRFYFMVGILILCFSGLLIWFVTKRITRPISELTQISRQMWDLDFNARYTSHAGNEIDVLGDSFNRMCGQLEKTISELKSANNQLQKDIQDKIKIDEMRKEFLDNVSHELKTPIALVQGYAEGLKENITDDVESREFYCDVIMDEAAKMNKLVKNLLTLNQLESGRDAAVMERFDLCALIRGVLDTMEIMISQKEARVLFDDSRPVFVWADEFKTEEVVTNYVSNALNHLDGDRQIEIKIHDEHERVRVTVFNTGNPIPEEDVPNLWNKFYKVDKARTREYGGSGIGLSIVKAIIESMNQEYGVVNYDNGVEFWFTLSRK